jgi:hypothetical protein
MEPASRQGVHQRRQRAEEVHRKKLALLVQERQRILSQQTVLLKGYAAAGARAELSQQPCIAGSSSFVLGTNARVCERRLGC